MKIMIVDDHPLIRVGLRLALADLEPGIEIIEAQRTSDALALAKQHSNIDLILLDLTLPGENGLSALPELRAVNEEIPVVILSGSFDQADVETSIEGGAMGFIPKTLPTKELLNALRVVLSGKSYLPESLVFAHAATHPMQSENSRSALKSFGLTPRESEVAALLLKALPSKVIARELNIALGTVKQHLHVIQQKLGARSRFEIMLKAQQLGISFTADPPRQGVDPRPSAHHSRPSGAAVVSKSTGISWPRY